VLQILFNLDDFNLLLLILNQKVNALNLQNKNELANLYFNLYQFRDDNNFIHLKNLICYLGKFYSYIYINFSYKYFILLNLIIR
jgi:hypothetical protein